MDMEMNGLSHPLAYWLANDIVLSQGQQGTITDLGYYKIGDGNNPFSGLTVQGLAPVNVWFSEFGALHNTGSSLCTIYEDWLIGGSLIQQGNWVDFAFDVTATNNSNSKNVYVKFANQTLINITLPSVGSSYSVSISGKIKCIDYLGGKAFYVVKQENSNVNYAESSGTLSGINWNSNNAILLQFQGVATGDITSNGAEGKINTIPRF